MILKFGCKVTNKRAKNKVYLSFFHLFTRLTMIKVAIWLIKE
jgi:hypothetical protein